MDGIKTYDLNNDVKIQKTIPGQGYHIWHCEAADLLSSRRLLFVFMYLNTCKEGGETEFPVLDKVFSPIAGKGIIWNNLNEDGSPNENTMHQAHPVLKGEKTIITKWFREKL